MTSHRSPGWYSRLDRHDKQREAEKAKQRHAKRNELKKERDRTINDWIEQVVAAELKRPRRPPGDTPPADAEPDPT